MVDLCWWSTDSSVELGLVIGLVRPPCEVLKARGTLSLASVHLVPPYLLQCPTSVYIRRLTLQGFQSGLRDQIGEEAAQGSQAGQGEGLGAVIMACLSQPSLPAWPEAARDRLKGLPGHCCPLLGMHRDL